MRTLGQNDFHLVRRLCCGVSDDRIFSMMDYPVSLFQYAPRGRKGEKKKRKYLYDTRNPSEGGTRYVYLEIGVMA